MCRQVSLIYKHSQSYIQRETHTLIHTATHTRTLSWDVYVVFVALIRKQTRANSLLDLDASASVCASVCVEKLIGTYA